MKHLRLICTLGVICIVASVLFIAVTPSRVAAAQLYLNKERLGPNQTSIVIIPIMTASAYSKGGFYDYYEGRCGTECLTVKINQGLDLHGHASGHTKLALEILDYGFINDYILDYMLQSDPHYLDQYDKVIVLHSEYVTQAVFDALQHHKKVIYLAPNALHAKVTVNKGVMTLVQGHSYNNKYNGFDWPYDNTAQEYENTCKDWKFVPLPNGYQLNCNGEESIYRNFDLLKELRNL